MSLAALLAALDRAIPEASVRHAALVKPGEVTEARNAKRRITRGV
jgi:hypothetical protein